VRAPNQAAGCLRPRGARMRSRAAPRLPSRSEPAGADAAPPAQLDSADPAAARNVTVLLRAVLPGDMWMGVGLSMDGVSTVWVPWPAGPPHSAAGRSGTALGSAGRA
jgi:hypothetical protein